MNFEDFNGEEALKEARKEYGVDDPLDLIFYRQLELMRKYLPLEDEILGVHLSTGSLIANLDHARDQHLLKARAWWTTEELVEALDALKEHHKSKFIEELIDALHFLVELCILSGLGPLNVGELESELETDSSPPFDPPLDYFEVRERVLMVIESLGMGMWQLRNKPWKQTQITTDTARYHWNIVQALELLFYLILDCVQGGMKTVAAIYLQKSLVNQFRIRSNY